MQDAETALILLTSALFFALLIERIIEVLVSGVEYVEARINGAEFWNRRAEFIRARLQRRLDLAAGHKVTERILVSVAMAFLKEGEPQSGSLAISATKVRRVGINGIAKLIGMGIGITLAFKFDINIFAILQAVEENFAVGNTAVDEMLKGWAGRVISGIAMGLGSSPVHKFIVRLESARKSRQSIYTE